MIAVSLPKERIIKSGMSVFIRCTFKTRFLVNIYV